MPGTDIPAFVTDWYDALEAQSLADAAPEPRAAAIFTADVINGFFRFGALASPRIDGLTGPIVSLFQRAWEHGVREYVLCQDTHSPDTPEFNAYPPHCVAGSEESATIPELTALPFAGHYTIVPKNSLHPAVGTVFDDWMNAHREIRTAIVVGDCTDLCVYQLAMHLRVRANALNIQDFDVIVPADCVTTFDIPGGDNPADGIAHPAEFFHQVFLYHMASNGIRIVRELA